MASDFSSSSIIHLFALCLSFNLTLSTANSTAQSNEARSPSLHQWGAVTLFHGLPSDHVRAIAQDRDGVMWLGTDAGLVRYDGRRVQKISTEGPLARAVRMLRLDQDGALWIGTDAGAVRMIGEDFRIIPETEDKAVTAIITPERGRAILATAQGALFDIITRSDDSLAIRSIENDTTLRLDSGRALPFASLALLGDAIIVGSQGRGLLSIQNERVEEIPLRPRPFFIEAIAQDAQGKIWIGAQAAIEDSGLFECSDLRRASKLGEGVGTVTSIAFAASGDLWVGTDQRGAFHFRGSQQIEHFTFASTAGGLRSDHVYSTFIDREGVIWFGTNRGACRYDPMGWRAEMISTDSESNFARVLFQPRDSRIWCGTNRGLFVRNFGAWRQAGDLKSRTVHAIAQDSRGRMLIGTASGLFVSDDGLSFARIAEGESIRAICEFKGAIYAASYAKGVERLEGEELISVWPAQQGAQAERQTTSLHADRNGRLWIGTAGAGVIAFDGSQATSLPALDPLKRSAVWSIAGSEDERLWIGTSRGLYAFSAGALAPVIEDVDVRQVIGRGARAWCATADGGLYAVLIDDEAGVIVSRVSAEQGLPSQNTFAILADKFGQLWAGTNRGIARYTPSALAPPLRAARVIGIRAFSNQEIARGINLEYPQKSLSIEVAAASSRTFPEQFQYWFSLVDSSGRAVKSKLSREPQMIAENLKPGRYTVKARALTVDLAISDPLFVSFEIGGAPFPWTTTALSLLLGAALAAIVWGYYQNRKLTRTNEALEGANRQLAETRMQLASETEAERRRIARDLHDQTLADLRRLLMLADQLPGKRQDVLQSIDPLVFRREIESISTEIRRICEDLSPSALENVGLAAALEYALADAVAHLPPEKRFEYEFICDEGLEEKLKISPAIQIQIYRICQEAISNVCRHADARRVKLSVEVSDGAFALTLEDDGCGFDARGKRARTGRGIANICSRASLIEAEVEWSRMEEGGTRFTLQKSLDEAVRPAQE